MLRLVRARVKDPLASPGHKTAPNHKKNWCWRQPRECDLRTPAKERTGLIYTFTEETIVTIICERSIIDRSLASTDICDGTFRDHNAQPFSQYFSSFCSKEHLFLPVLQQAQTVPPPLERTLKQLADLTAR